MTAEIISMRTRDEYRAMKFTSLYINDGSVVATDWLREDGTEAKTYPKLRSLIKDEFKRRGHKAPRVGSK